MKVHGALALARDAKAANPTRPATMIMHDSPDARVVLFRIEPGQQVAVHTSASTVVVNVLAGHGIVADAAGDRPAHAGDIVTYDPREPHGFRATDTTFILAAVITPRPGDRA